MADFDRILSSAPVNAAAARQLSAGEHWTPTAAIQDCLADLPLLKPAQYYADKASVKNHEFVDFRGMTFERLTVVGMMEKESNTPASWVCRCKCGSFCTRSSRSLKVAMRGGNSFVGMCGMCDYQRKLREGWAPKPKGVLRRG